MIQETSENFPDPKELKLLSWLPSQGEGMNNDNI